MDGNEWRVVLAVGSVEYKIRSHERDIDPQGRTHELAAFGPDGVASTVRCYGPRVGFWLSPPIGGGGGESARVALVFTRDTSGGRGCAVIFEGDVPVAADRCAASRTPRIGDGGRSVALVDPVERGVISYVRGPDGRWSRTYIPIDCGVDERGFFTEAACAGGVLICRYKYDPEGNECATRVYRHSLGGARELLMERPVREGEELIRAYETYLLFSERVDAGTRDETRRLVRVALSGGEERRSAPLRRDLIECAALGSDGSFSVSDRAVPFEMIR